MLSIGWLALGSSPVLARPAHVRTMADYLGPFAAKNFVTCQTCHLAKKPTDEEHAHTTG
jgi:hypothetical protein